MELEGSISSFDVTEIFQFIAGSQLTGICNLILEEKNKVQVFFNSGKIAGVAINNQMLPLKDILVHRQKLSYNTYHHILKENSVDEKDLTPSTLARLLIKDGFLTEEEITSLARLYTEEEVLDLFRFKKGDFKFDNMNSLNVDLYPLLSIEVEPLVIEGNRRNQEWVKFLSEIYSENLIFANEQVDKTFFYNATLSFIEWRVFSMLSGKLSVSALFKVLDISRYELYRSLYNLLKLGLISPQNLFEFDLYSKRVEKEAYTDLHKKPVKPEVIAQEKEHIVKEKGFSFKTLLRFAGFSTNTEEKQATFPIEKYKIKSSVGVFILFNNLFYGSLSQNPEFTSTEEDRLLYINLWKEKIIDYPRIDIVKFGTEGLEWHKYERLKSFVPEDLESFKNTTEDIIHALHDVLLEIYDIASRKMGEEKIRKTYKGFYRSLITELERLQISHLNKVPQKVWK